MFVRKSRVYVLTWLDDPEESYDHYRRNGGDTTINSILGRPLDAPVDGVEDAKRVATEAADLVEFIRQMPFVVETDKVYLCSCWY